MTETINIWIALLLFIVYVIFDILYGWYILAVNRLNAELAGILSIMIGVISYGGVIKITDNPWYGVPIVLGGGLGTYFLIKWEKWRKNKSDKSKKDVS
jgi:hypothetical protein